MSNMRGNLTQFTEGSVKELWAISFPLILSMFSINVMTFVDRLILARYDIRAMNAAVVAGLVFSIFQFGAMGIAAVSEVFVGQYNGANKYRKIGEPVWQMIWFSLMTSLFFIPMGLWAGQLFIPNPEYAADGIPFFKWMMLFGPAFPLVTALSSFFVGRGSVTLVMITTVLSNVLNILLDFLLIFGVQDLIPAMGASGAAIATGASQAVQAILLVAIFLHRRHREKHGTGEWVFKPKLFWQVLKVGFPSAMSSIIELSAWSVLAQILASKSDAHITLYSIGDSFFVLFTFGFWGLQKGITTVVANYIGAGREDLKGKCLVSGIKIVVAIMLLFSIPLCFFPEALVNQFLNPEASLEMNQELMAYATIAMRWLWLYFILDAISWLICGVLTAAGDTKFVMIMNSISAWVFAIIPSYFIFTYLNTSPVVTWIICAGYGLLNSFSFFLRYRSQGWYKKEPLHALA